MRTYVISVRLSDQQNEHYKDDEFFKLACSLSALSIKKNLSIRLVKSDPAFFISKGHLHNIKNYVLDNDIGLVLIDNPLSPIQQRNLEKELNCKVLDRTNLILEIFGSRAKSNEGKLSVMLASLEYQKSRLVRSWTHLERQRGGAGFMGGPGEKQIESDRRQITERINRLKKKIKN